MYSNLNYSSGISSRQNDFSVYPYTDNTGFYVTGFVSSTNLATLCRYIEFKLSNINRCKNMNPK